MAAASVEGRPGRARAAALLIPGAVFFSAVLVFLVQPLVGRLLLPSLGGAPGVWNTSLVFFQAALLVGYAYAHALQRIRRLDLQAAVHLALLLAAAVVLPLRAGEGLGAPSESAPTAWLLLQLALIVGAPFAVLSATAPLLQAWWAVRFGGRRDPYPLYAASNLGSLAALLAYPLVLEPALTLEAQRLAWTAGYGLFVLAAAAVGLSVRDARTPARAEVAAGSARNAWRQRAWWALLGAIPSSLLLGVTAHISTDVASAPFLWVGPLALYLLTFVIAFQSRPWLPPGLVLIAQAVAAPATLAALPFSGDWRLFLPLHLAAFFFTALMCHQRLAADRPPSERLTEFYLALSVGGVLGGAFNALLAPVIFDQVWEYPLALIAAVLARPVGRGRPSWTEGAVLAWGALAAAAVLLVPDLGPDALWAKLAIASSASAAFILRDRAPLAALMLLLTAAAAVRAATDHNFIRTERSFFGVYRVAYNTVPELGPVRFLMHGTTLHGAQQTREADRCRPLTYYAAPTPLGQALSFVQRRGPVAVGVVGLGAGSMAAVTRPGDRLTFYEIDPLVETLARESFGFLACARGTVSTVIGDARLTVAEAPAGGLDLLIVDAFSSDAVPTHLMTVEAMQGWLRALKPDGLLVLHISNRNLELEAPVAAAAVAAGGVTAARFFRQPRGAPPMAASSTHAVAAARDPRVIDALRREGWREARIDGVRPWTDDRTDVLGALLRGGR